MDSTFARMRHNSPTRAMAGMKHASDDDALADAHARIAELEAEVATLRTQLAMPRPGAAAQQPVKRSKPDDDALALSATRRISVDTFKGKPCVNG